MITTNKNFQFICTLRIRKSNILNDSTRPAEDKLNWLFIKIYNKKYSFVYRIIDPLNAEYASPFDIEMSLIFPELIHDKIEILKDYEVFRGEENIGIIRIKEHI